MNRSLLLVLPLVVLTINTGGALADDGPALKNGSRICDSSRNALVAIDASYTLTGLSQKIIYAAGVEDNDCEMESQNSHSLEFRLRDGSRRSMA